MKGNRLLNKTFIKAQKREIEFTDKDKFIIFSDHHRGTNDWGDDFAHNQLLFFHALTSYYEDDFTYIENGDGDELGENWCFRPIRKAHSHVFWLIRKFHQAGRLYLVYGNHDIIRRFPWVVSKTLKDFFNRRTGKKENLFRDIKVQEAIVLKHKDTGKKVFIVHGHQVDFFNSYLWWIGFLFLPIWKGVCQKILGWKDPTSPAKSRWKRDRLTNHLRNWAEINQQIIIAGHTHKSIFPTNMKKPYFNDGSCVHPRCITGIEIANGEITLVKWWLATKRIDGEMNRDMIVTRESMMRDEHDQPLPPIRIKDLLE